MNSKDFTYGFRVLGDCQQPRRIVDASTTLAAYAACDEGVDLDSESYLSAFQFDVGFREHLNTTGSTADYRGPCWAPFICWDIHGADGELEDAKEGAKRLTRNSSTVGSLSESNR